MSDMAATPPDGGVIQNETERLIASDKVEGTAVYDRAGNRLGSIQHIMLEKRSGQAAYAVMSFGGFLGIGEKYHPLPWNALTYDPTVGGYVVDTTREQLEGAPAYEAEASPWSDPAYGRGVNDYYGLPYQL